MQAVIFSLELVKTFFNMSEPVWVYDVTFLALFGGWKGSFDFTSEHKFDRICNWLITQISYQPSKYFPPIGYT